MCVKFVDLFLRKKAASSTRTERLPRMILPISFRRSSRKRTAELAHQVVVGDYKTLKNRLRSKLCFKQQHRETAKRFCPAHGEWHW